jgi:hypothetical protein
MEVEELPDRVTGSSFMTPKVCVRYENKAPPPPSRFASSDPFAGVWDEQEGYTRYEEESFMPPTVCVRYENKAHAPRFASSVAASSVAAGATKAWLPAPSSSSMADKRRFISFISPFPSSLSPTFTSISATREEWRRPCLNSQIQKYQTTQSDPFAGVWDEQEGYTRYAEGKCRVTEIPEMVAVCEKLCSSSSKVPTLRMQEMCNISEMCKADR